MATFSEMKYALDEIARKNARAREILANGRTQIVRAQTDLGEMTSDYSGIVSDINQAAVDNPTDTAYTVLKAEKDKLVADFQDLKTYADALVTAYDGVSE